MIRRSSGYVDQFVTCRERCLAISLQIMQAVTIIHTSDQELTLEWVSSVSNDMIADSTLALLCGIDSNYATIKRKMNALMKPFRSHPAHHIVSCSDFKGL